MADQPDVTGAGVINDQALKHAYLFLCETLDKAGLKATAAFVSAFAAERDVVQQLMPLLEQMAALNPWWFCNFLVAVRKGNWSGWSGSAQYRQMALAGHEMAWHGTTHLPLPPTTSVESVELELVLADKLFDAMGSKPKTVVFPKNQVGQLDRLRQFGFETYRASAQTGAAARIRGLASEFNVWGKTSSDYPMTQNGWNVSPAGLFLNWPYGVRSLVPVQITVQRWKSLLRNAAEQGGYVHMWFHPHNLITAPSMKLAFAEIMRFAGELVKAGDMCNLTMSEASEYYAQGSVA